MSNKIIQTKEAYYRALNQGANRLSKRLFSKYITRDLLKTITIIYTATRSEKRLFEKDKTHFECAYHESASSDLEFLLAKIFDNYSIRKKLHWKVLLRKQSKRDGKQLVPDIEIKKKNKTIAIIEIKIKGGWIQYLFSEIRKKHDRKRKKSGKSAFDPDEEIKKQKYRIKKFGINKKKVFFIIPSLCSVYKKKHDMQIEDYRNHFCRQLGIPNQNLIILSKNPRLNLDIEEKIKNFDETQEFNKMLKKIL